MLTSADIVISPPYYAFTNLSQILIMFSFQFICKVNLYIFILNV